MPYCRVPSPSIGITLAKNIAHQYTALYSPVSRSSAGFGYVPGGGIVGWRIQAIQMAQVCFQKRQPIVSAAVFPHFYLCIHGQSVRSFLFSSECLWMIFIEAHAIFCRTTDATTTFNENLPFVVGRPLPGKIHIFRSVRFIESGPLECTIFREGRTTHLLDE